MRQRNGIARIEHGKFETLESRSLLAAHGLVCLAPGVHESTSGEIFYIDGVLDTPTVQPSAAGTTSDLSGPQIDVNRVPLLHSDASSSQKIYLDFNGQAISGTGWNELNLGRPIHAPAFDIDGDTTTFSTTERAVIENVWARVSEDFAPFEVDVTTEAPSARALRAGSQAIRVLISSNVDSVSGRTWLHAGYGVAYVNSWRSASDTPAWVFANRLGGSDKRIAESVSHEVGHTLGLHHDGIHNERGDDTEYFSGHGDQDTGWAPIMGLGYHRPVTQWDRGEYLKSNNSEHDIEVITAEPNRITERADDYPNDLIFAHHLESDAFGSVSKHGLISTRTDRDAFRIELEPGTIDLLVAPASRGANLDLEVTLYDQHGRLIETYRSDTQRATNVQAHINGGTHYIVVDGVGRGDPTAGGYSDYGSIGRYTISGTLPASQVSALTQIRSAAKRLID